MTEDSEVRMRLSLVEATVTVFNGTIRFGKTEFSEKGEGLPLPSAFSFKEDSGAGCTKNGAS